jgi:hypothetical protein
MPLPTTNLTLHLDASDTDKLFTTWADGGVHTGTPGDGDLVQAWKVETDGSVTPCNAAYNGGNAPAYRSGTPLMLLPCLDFDGTNDAMAVVSDTGVTSYRTPDQFFSTTARTIVGAFYAESISSTNSSAAASYSNEGVIAGDDKFFLNFRNAAGQRKLQFGGHDGAWKMVEVDISEGATVVFSARHDGTNLYLSVDGGAESSAACGTLSGDGSQIYIGRGGDGPRFNGRLGEAGFYSVGAAYPTAAVDFLREKWQGISSGVVGGLADGKLTSGILFGRLVK